MKSFKRHQFRLPDGTDAKLQNKCEKSEKSIKIVSKFNFCHHRNRQNERFFTLQSK